MQKPKVGQDVPEPSAGGMFQRDAMSPSVAHKPVLELKGNLLSLMVLYLFDSDRNLIEQQFTEKISGAKNFFKNAPIVIDLHALQNTSVPVDLSHLSDLFRKHGLVPVGVRGGNVQQQQAALNLSLGILPDAKPASSRGEPQTEVAVQATRDKVFTQPVRSGQQVAALQGDLVVLAAVNPGAEILAGKNIHVYGPLRGRAIAGVHGYSEARIFCRYFDAELVAVAGQYMLNEDFEDSVRGKPVHIFLENDRLKIQPFEI
ncbi:septum site-determining protein MinC [Syntrophus aciditrophicus]|nr:septum site-determining protein MinC [Syntrophus aciditrophicus]